MGKQLNQSRSNEKTFIIAEAGVNHNGSIQLAKQLIDSAFEAGADAVKFQTFKAEKEMSRKTPKADYQLRTTDPKETPIEMAKKLELDLNAHRELKNHCSDRGIQFISTPSDLESVDWLVNDLDLDIIKVASGDITDAPLLLKIASTGKPVILSTGMSYLGDIELALGVLAFGYMGSHDHPSISNFYRAFCSSEGQKLLKEKVILLHCTSEYPTPFNAVNLKALDSLGFVFKLPIGLSDHTQGTAIALAAVARGATVIEKHFTLDRTLPGPDHEASIEPDELESMIKSIREIENALGSGLKVPSSCEVENRKIVRKSIVAAKNIKTGETFTIDNITCKRPGMGISPTRYWDVLGRVAERDYQEDDEVYCDSLTNN